MKDIVFIDAEINPKGGKILDLGAIASSGSQLHTKSTAEFAGFVSTYSFVCGHNIVEFDSKYLENYLPKNVNLVDTLPMSPLLFPMQPYHKLVKDDKLVVDSLSNPLNDAIKAQELFFDEINAFNALSDELKHIFTSLLSDKEVFKGFFAYVESSYSPNLSSEIKQYFSNKICANADLENLIFNFPIELAFALTLINVSDKHSITPPWVYKSYPCVENVMYALRGTRCRGCDYCNSHLDVNVKLKEIFGFDSFRTYNGEPLQERAAAAAVAGKSLLAIFPTGGGKSITFQLPALMAGESTHGLTVVVSPLQSLMKDQVDNLEEKGIVDAVTINGMLNPIERADAIERVVNGSASILYISPEMLRSKTIEKMLMGRHISRFIIDEAHCFSAWGQDFRVDYLYIGDFIKKLQDKKHINNSIPVSCFTATAKQKVVRDICDYFNQKLGVDLELYTTTATRTNLHYAVIHVDTQEDRYAKLRNLISMKNCPTIVYCSRTKRTLELAEKLSSDGFKAIAFNGKMERQTKIINQDTFISGNIDIIVATSAFGMGVDKSNVGLVVHYDISDSLENYVQEAGRAGRDQSLQAECYILYNEEDLDKHFLLLNQTRVTKNEIQQVWRGIKQLTKTRNHICVSALEIARSAGWDDTKTDIETRVRTALQTLENTGYIERGMNVPHVYADSIAVHNLLDARKKIEASGSFDESQTNNAIRILSSLITSRSTYRARNDEAESRVDYISDRLGIKKADVIEAINLLRQEGILSDNKDLTAFVKMTSKNNIAQRFGQVAAVEEFLLSTLKDGNQVIDLKEINEAALEASVKSSSVMNIKTVLLYWKSRGFIENILENTDRHTIVNFKVPLKTLKENFASRTEIVGFIADYIFTAAKNIEVSSGDVPVEFSVLELKNAFNDRISLTKSKEASFKDIEAALLYLLKINAVSIEGGFLVLYNAMQITRLITDNRIQFKQEDYSKLEEYYGQKVQQIHIVGEYAKLMISDYNAALIFVSDYFQMDYKLFLSKYFPGDRKKEISRNITPDKYEKLFGDLSEKQRQIIDDDTSQHIVVLAGPGSGKTRVLVHKMASLLQLEDVKHEQLLMLTFSRAAATEFKSRLLEMIGGAAHFVEIKTFHSYCFDLLGKIGSLEESENVVEKAAEMIEQGEVEMSRITKTVLLIDEAQDMDEHEFALVKALMNVNDDMRVIAVGDDDQNIYEFRGSNSSYFKSLVDEYDAKKYEMTENYRSCAGIVSASNVVAHCIGDRMKSEDVVPVNMGSGIVKYYRYLSSNMEEPVVNQILSNNNPGTTCVLTNTNDAALRISSLLNKRGKRARLIQAMDGFNLYNIIEIRQFISLIEKYSVTPTVPYEIWDGAQEKVHQMYNFSSFLPLFDKILETFASVNKVRYKTDFISFINESKIEDFYGEDENVILVSTLHKAKGKEFDNVYIVLDKATIDTNEKKRVLYVGMTRAKHALYVNFCNNLSQDLIPVRYDFDKNQYDEPDEIMLQLTHRDVNLGYFKDKKQTICLLRSGQELLIDEKGLCASVNGKDTLIVKYSKSFNEQLKTLESKGYHIDHAQVRFILAWHDKNEESDKEEAIVLPDLYLKRLS